MIWARHGSSPPRRWVGAALWVASGLCFVATAFVPWMGSGLLSRSSPVDLAGLSRSEVLTSIPDWLPWLVVVMPLAGAALVGFSLFPRWWPLRVALLLAAVLLWAAILRELGGTSPGGWALGAWVGAAGVGLGVAATLADRWSNPSGARRQH